MNSRQRRQYFLAEENYGNKYVKKPRRTKVDLHENPSSSSESDTEESDCASDKSSNGTLEDISVPGNLLHKSPSLMSVDNTHPEHADENDFPNANDMSQPVEELSEIGDDSDEAEFLDHGAGSSNGIFSSSAKKKAFQCLSNLENTDVLFMVLNYYIRHGLSQSALEDLLKLLNVIAGVKTFPESFSSFSSLFHLDPYNSYRVYFCSSCHFDYETAVPEETLKCPVCECMQKDFFLVIPVEQQVRELVVKYMDKIEKYAKDIDEQEIADINRGKIAKENRVGTSGTVLTLSANTDGAATYKCTTQKPLYPVFLTLNNLPPIERFSKHNLMINALWLSKGEPNTNLLFKYMCIELISLDKKGLNINGTVYSIKLLQVNLDSVARCKVLNMKQYNGNYGCTYCLHPGDIKESGTSRCYPVRKQVEIRQNNVTRKRMDEVCEDGNERLGIIGKSVFVSLRGFDIIASFPPDYMHAVLLGVMKQMWTMWTESEYHKNPFYIGNSLNEVEKRLLTFRPPSSFSRYPRQLKEYKKYKANEWEALLLHYIYPALVGILPQHYLDHVMLLSSAIFKLLSPKLSASDIDNSEKLLNRFQSKFQTLYGKDRMTYNVHLLGHFIQAVRNFGALYNYSLFPYESGNAMLLGFRTGNNKPILQIAKKYCMNKMCHYKELPKTSPIQKWVNKLWITEHAPLQYDPRTINHLCNEVVYDDDVEEREFSVHSRYHKKGFNLCSRDICKDFNYDDSWIEINGYFYSIINILCDKNSIVYIIGQQAIVRKKYDNLFSFHLSEVKRVLRINDSIQQCITMQINNKQKVEKFISRCKNRTQED